MTDIYVIVSAYNEAQNIESLLRNMQSQTYKGFNLIVVDDCSTDNTFSIASKYSKTHHFTDIFKSFNLVSAVSRFGKDENIRGMLEHIKGDALILITDADCTLPATWVESMLSEYNKTKASMLIGPVEINGDYPVQATEFLSIQMVTRASAAFGTPLMCGGANLAFTTEAYRISKEFMPHGKPNGADMYLLDAMKLTKQKIVAVTNPAATVLTRGKDTISGFLHQRTRWAGKALDYRNKSITATAAVVLLIQLFFIVILILSPFHPEFLYYWAAKVILDFCMLSVMAVKNKVYGLIPYILPVSVIYPFYVTAVFINTIIERNKR